MKIDNSKTMVKNWLTGLLSSIGFILTIVVLIAFRWEHESFLYKFNSQLAILLGSIYVTLNLYFFLKNRNYFFYSDESGKLEFRYYSSRPFSTKNNMIMIPPDIFMGYEIIRGMFYYSLVLKQKSSRGGVAKYPAISLSALSKEELNNLFSSLDSYFKK